MRYLARDRRSLESGTSSIDRAGVWPVVVSSVESQPLGIIGVVTVTANGDAIVIGGTTPELFVIHPDGRAAASPVVLQAIGASLGRPIAAAAQTDSEITVIDGQSALWARVRRSHGRWGADNSVSAKLSGVSDACTCRGRRFVMAKLGRDNDGGSIHEVNDHGDVLKSFGEKFGDIPNPAVRVGRLLCADAADGKAALLIMTSRLYPEIRAYTLDGVQRWKVPTPGFRAVGFRTQGRAVLFDYADDSIWDQSLSLTQPALGVFALQVGRQHGRNASTPYSRVTTTFLSTDSGKFLGTQTDLPIIDAMSKRSIYAVTGKDATELRVYSFEYRSHP